MFIGAPLGLGGADVDAVPSTSSIQKPMDLGPTLGTVRGPWTDAGRHGGDRAEWDEYRQPARF